MSQIIDQFLAHVSENPTKTALIVGESQCSYAALEQKARDLAQRFLAMGQGRALKIGLALEDCSEFIEVILACLWSGEAAVIADPDWPPTALATNLRGVSIDLLIAEDQIVSALQGVLPDVPVIARSALEQWQAGNGQDEIPKASGDAAFLIGFTSGSTGQPKAFWRSQKSWETSFCASDQELPTRQGDILLCPGLMKHTLGLYAILYALARGATAIGARVFGPSGPEHMASAMLDIVVVQKVTQMALIPPMAHWLARAAQQRNLVFPQVQQITTTAMKLSQTTATLLKVHFPNAAVVEYYGAAEIGFMSIAKPGAAVPDSSVGRAMLGVSLSVRNPETNAELAPGEIGLIAVKSPYLSAGYLFETDQGGFRLLPDGAATVGDYGWLDKQNNLTLSGRENNLMISGGHKVYPGEIERIIRNFTDVETLCVFGLPNPIWGDVVCLATAPLAVSSQDLASLCFAKLPPERCPQIHFGLTRLPSTTTGKTALGVLRDEMQDRFGAQLAAMTMGALKTARARQVFIEPTDFAK